MAALTYDPDHVARGVARLIERYRKPRTSALLESWLAEVQEAEDALWQLLVDRSLATAEGDQLDVLGKIVGQPREGRSDDVYRLWISARNMVLRSSGRTEEMLKIARTLVGATDTVALDEYYPAAFVMRLDGDLTLTLGYQIAYMLRQAKPAGVQFQMTWSVSAPAFRFSPDDSPVLDSPYGFDAGRFVAVGDGLYNPPVEAEGEVPEGALVIEGIPLTIDGAYLVITPPALAVAAVAPAPAPLVAKPVRIIPRAPASLLAPAPLAGETIELVDAFDDASLEMNEAGLKFRVAAALQTQLAEHEEDLNSAATDIAMLEGAVGALQAADTAHDAAIDALEAEVAALRFPFTLRTTSLDNSNFEEIGLLRFDPTPFGAAFDFVAELEVSIAGQTAELQLYDLTAAAAVTTLSSGSLTTAKQTASVTLPLAEHLYSVRLRRVGGGSGQFVSCRRLMFER